MSYQQHQPVNDSFAILSIDTKTTKTGKSYLLVELVNQHGPLMAKVWPTSMDQVKLVKNQVFKLNGRIDEYNGALSLIIEGCEPDTTKTLSEMIPETHRTPTVVFDIETVGKPFSALDEEEQNYLLNKLEKDSPTPEAAQEKTGLHPLFGEVGFVAMLNPYTRQGVILGQASDLSTLIPAEPEYEFKAFGNEADLLKEFWLLMSKFQNFVTYNGHGFDWPFLLFRSAVHRIPIPFEIKLHADNFIDLQRKLRPGYSRPYSLEMITKALGLRNPKAEGVAGNQVTKLYQAKEYQMIADYVSRDVLSTAELYKVWAEYLAGKIIV